MIKVNCHVSIEKDGICFLGPVKIELLQEIKKRKSLSRAAKKLKYSYQHAWTMIDDMNNAAPEPLVIKQRGGVNGGGTEISEYGKKIIAEYLLIQNEIQKVVNQINVEINL